MVSGGSELIGLLFSAYLLFLLSGTLLLPFIPVRHKATISIILVFLIAVLTSALAFKALAWGAIEIQINGGLFFGIIPLRIDSLTAFFILIINFTAITGVLYGTGYLKSVAVRPSVISLHWILYILFHSSMLAVTMVQHSIVFLIAWEIMSLSSLFLVVFEHENPKVLKAGINYLVQMHISVVFLTVGFIWVYFKTGTFDFRGISSFFSSNDNIWLFLVFFLGFGLKAGFVGLHTWLPKAHPAAPSHISGVMSGVIVKMGIYGIFRIISYLKSDFLIIGEIVLSVSLMTGLFGIMNAAVHRDFKKLLAYCTIENIGIIGIGIGIGLIGISKGQSLLCFLGFGGALVHVLNHSLFKSLLFYSAGSVYKQTHTRDMDKLGGLIKVMPSTALFFLIGSIAIGGIPPFNGFISEFLIYSGIIHGINTAGISQLTLMIITFAGMSIIGGVSIITFTKTFGTIFLGNARQRSNHKPVEVSFIMLLPQYLIVCLMILISVFPGYVIQIMTTVLNTFRFPGINMFTAESERYIFIMQNISITSLLFIALSGILFFVRYTFIRGKEQKISSTWGCGYVNPNTHMQYTGKSYSKSFGKLLNFMLIEKKRYEEIDRNDTFPETRKYSSFYLDVIENKIIDPIIQLITYITNKFQFIQNGKVQAYVIYGIVFILTIFILTVLTLIN